MRTIKSVSRHSLLQRQSGKQEVVASSTTAGNNCSFFGFFLRASQLDLANTNEINCDIHLAQTLFLVGNGMYLLVQFSLKYNLS